MRAPARELFRDSAFPASDSSIFSSFSTPLVQFREEITWRRPQEICAEPRLFADSPQEGQVKQGLLGDCWFLCACAALQKSRRLLDQVFPPGQPSWLDQTYRGSFTCRVWQFGRWVEVTVDDRLPCLAGRLCFSRCQREDVFWLPLLEKAYAKVSGSYEHLPAGTYRIVPSTYLPDTEGAFTVTVETRIDRRSIHSQEMLGQLLTEASFMAVMKS